MRNVGLKATPGGFNGLSLRARVWLSIVLSDGHFRGDQKSEDEEPAVHHGSERLTDCLKRWDAGSHLTKTQWRRTCERVRTERQPYLKANRHTD